MAAERHNLFAMLFSSRSLPFMQIWNGTFVTDGHSAKLLKLNLLKPTIKGKFREAIVGHGFGVNEAAGTVTGPTGERATPLQIFQEFMLFKPNWANEDALSGSLGKCYKICDRWQHTGKKPGGGKQAVLETRVESLVHRLYRQQRHLVGMKGEVTPRRGQVAAEPPNSPAAPVPPLNDRPALPRAILQPRFASVDKRTQGGLLKSTLTLRPSTRNQVLSSMKALLRRCRPDDAQRIQGLEAVELVREYISCGFDPGEYNPFASAVVNRMDDTSKSLVMTHHGLEHNRRKSQRDSAKTRNRFLADVAVDAIKAEEDYQNGRAGGAVDWETKNKRDAVNKRLAEQLAEAIWPESFCYPRPRSPVSRIFQPALFSVGDGCGKSKHGVGVKHIEASTSLLRSVIHHLQSQGYPLLVIWADEAYSSQCCPDPSCLRPPGDDWKAELPDAEADDDIPENWVRGW